MSVEYVLFGIEEAKDIKKGLLQAQLSALKSEQYLQNYKKLRTQELAQKVKLKSILSQTQEELQVLKKILPEPLYKPSKHSKESHFIADLDHQEAKKQDQETAKTKANNLESQLEEIQRKLKMLS